MTNDIRAFKLGNRTTEAMHSALASLAAQNATKWYSRADIAKQIGKAALTSSERAALGLLVEAGRIEVRDVAAQAEIVRRLEYRVIESGEDEKSEGTA